MDDDDLIIKRLLNDLIIKIQEEADDEEESLTNINLLKTKIKTLEYKNRLANEENINLSKLFHDYKKDREEGYEKVIKILNEKINEKERELTSYENKINENELQKQQQIDQLHLDFKKQFEQAFKKFQEMQKDKNSMVMKYAEAEKKCMDLNRTNEHLQARINDFLKEKQRIMEKLEAKNQEKVKFNAELELKLTDISSLSKQIEKLKETNVLNEVKLNKFESKYKNEYENNIENKNLIVKLSIQLVKLRNSMINSKDGISEEDLLNLINDESTTSSSGDDLNKKYIKVSNDYNQLNVKNKQIGDELSQLRLKYNSIENENKANIIQIQSYKEALNSQNKMNKDLLSENLQLRELQVTLTR